MIFLSLFLALWDFGRNFVRLERLSRLRRDILPLKCNNMKTMTGQSGDRTESEILSSRTVKAGKRVYYIDVKRDRRGERYISVTESKRVRDGDENVRPVFEKHKIFLYREDFDKFVAAFGEMVAYAREEILPEISSQDDGSRDLQSSSENSGTDVSALGMSAADLHIDIEF